MMGYIKSVIPLKGHRLFLEMDTGSSAIIDMSEKLITARFCDIKDEEIFNKVRTDGDYVVWDEGRIKVTAKELIDVLLIG